MGNPKSQPHRIAIEAGESKQNNHKHCHSSVNQATRGGQQSSCAIGAQRSSDGKHV
jgi:hypothetical protein